MRKSLWVMAGMGLVGVMILTIGTQSMLSSYGGVDETLRLQDFLRASYGRQFAKEPPLRVLRSLGGPEEGWSWRVEGHLVEEPGARFARTLQRLAQRCASARVGGGRAKSTLVILHLPGGGERRHRFDAQGREIAPAVEAPNEPEPPEKEAVDPGDTEDTNRLLERKL